MSRKKDSPRPSGRCGCGDLHPARPHPPPHLHPSEGLLVCPFWIVAHFSADATPVACPSLTVSSHSGARRHSVTKLRKLSADIVGHTLAYLSPYWQGFHVWMVLDPNWGWEKKRFLGADAIAQDFESKDTSIIEGREVKLWTKLTRADVQRSPSRNSPSEEQTAIPSGGTRLIPSGWDHEHCELCNSHIDAGVFGYCDPDERWMCEKCYERYVMRRDLAFVDEI